MSDSKAKTIVSTPVAAQAPIVMTAAEKAKAAKREAKRVARAAKKAKRWTKLQVIKASDPLRFTALLSFAEAKGANMVDEKSTTAWKDFCTLKGNALKEYWTRKSTLKDGLSEKARERKQAQVEKIKAKMAELEAELAAG